MRKHKDAYSVLLRRVRETVVGVIVTSVDRVGQRALEVTEIGTESVAVQEQDVVRVDSSNSLFDPNVKVNQTSVFLVRRLVQRVVTGDPGVVLVVRGKVFPDFNGSVLEVLVYPDCVRGQGRVRTI